MRSGRRLLCGELISIEEVGRRYIAHAERRGRIDPDNVEAEVGLHPSPSSQDRFIHPLLLDLVAVLEEKDLSPKSIQNIVCTLGLFNFARAPQLPPGTARTRAGASSCLPRRTQRRTP